MVRSRTLSVLWALLFVMSCGKKTYQNPVAPAAEKSPATNPEPAAAPPASPAAKAEKKAKEQEVQAIAALPDEQLKKELETRLDRLPLSADERKSRVEKLLALPRKEAARRAILFVEAARYASPDKQVGFGLGFEPQLASWNESYAFADKIAEREDGEEVLALHRAAYRYATRLEDASVKEYPHALHMVGGLQFADRIAFRADGREVLLKHRKAFNEKIQYEKGQPNIRTNWQEAKEFADRESGL